MRRTPLADVAMALALLALVSRSSAAAPWHAPPAMLRPVPTATSFDVSPPLRDLVRMAEEPGEFVPFPDLHAPGEASSTQDVDAVVQGSTGVLAMPATIANFDGPINQCSCTPPAPSMDVGPNHVFVATNLRFAIYDKTGTLLVGPLANNTIWAGFGGPCQTNNSGYPMVLYDQLADRWLISQQSSSSAPFGFCVAVSMTGDPTGSWYRWSFSTGNNYVDQPKWALWPDAYYVGGGEYLNAATFVGAGAYAFERADLLAGDPTPSVVAFLMPPGATPHVIGHGLLPTDLDGAAAPPIGSDALFLGMMDNNGPFGASQDALTLWRFHADFATPANSSFVLASTLPTSAFNSIFTCAMPPRGCVPQAGTTNRVDFNAGRQWLLHRSSYRNFGTHQSIAVNQSVNVAPGIGGVRWYELRDPLGTPVIRQQGTYAPGTFDGIHRWMAGIAMDNDGNMALGYSASNASMFPSIRYTGRLTTDALGEMPQGEGTIIDGTGSQTITNRWGDYTTMAIDPVDDCTFWYVNEYYAVNGSAWRTRIASFKFPSCTPAVGVEEDVLSLARTSLVVKGPSRGRATLVLTLAGAAERHVQLDLFDLSGRRLRRLVDTVLPGGRYDATWDATDESGRAVEAGVYFARLRAGDERDAETILLLK